MHVNAMYSIKSNNKEQDEYLFKQFLAIKQN